MDDKQRLKLIKDFMFLQLSIDQRIHEFVSETIMKRDLSEEDLDKFKDSLNYVLNDRLSFVERSLKK